MSLLACRIHISIVTAMAECRGGSLHRLSSGQIGLFDLWDPREGLVTLMRWSGLCTRPRIPARSSYVIHYVTIVDCAPQDPKIYIATLRSLLPILLLPISSSALHRAELTVQQFLCGRALLMLDLEGAGQEVLCLPAGVGR